MKKTLVALAVLTLLVTAVSFGVARWSVHCAMTAPTVNLNDTAWLKHELNLTDAQIAEVGKLDRDFNTKIGNCCDKHCDARLALSKELEKSTIDLPKVNACVDQMTAAQAESEHATLNHILGIRALLTPEQQQHYAKLVSQQVCNSCPIDMSHKAQ
jgi:Spy/CpxP family protein refolding chaperone